MNGLNKRGVGLGFDKVIIGILILFIVIIGIVGIVKYNKGGAFSDALGESVEEVSNGAVSIFTPIFGVLLGLDKVSDANNKFLIIITFILISTIIVGVMDAVNIFDSGPGTKGNYINLIVGVIVSIIGVRFMPEDLWGTLTAPSSAFVATVLVGAPFIAFALISIKVGKHSSLASKGLWLFYVVFMSYLIFRYSSGPENKFELVYIVFLLLGLLMMILDPTFHKFYYQEAGKLSLERGLSSINLVERQKVRNQIEKLTTIISDPASSATDVTAAEAEIVKLKGRYPKLSI